MTDETEFDSVRAQVDFAASCDDIQGLHALALRLVDECERAVDERAKWEHIALLGRDLAVAFKELEAALAEEPV